MELCEDPSLEVEATFDFELPDPLVVLLQAVECSDDVVFTQLGVKVLLQSQLPIRHLIFLLFQRLSPDVGYEVIT